MLPLSILEKTSNSILYEIPAGKPNPTQQCSAKEEKRERVFQSSMKGAACWYYTFNFIRRRIGKNPSNELLNERKKEAICSQLRKEQRAYDDAFPVPIGQLYSSSCNLAESFEGLSNTVATCFQEFINEKHDSLLCERAAKIIELNMKFLSNFRTDVHKLTESQCWKEMNINDKAAVLDAYVRDFSADLYNLEKSSWHPLQGIDKLIEELKEKGPLMILGDFGTSAYIDEPFKMNKKISDRDIYAWHSGSNRNKSLSGHSVLLVGAKKTQDNAFAYFIDSCDPSDPSDKSKQKIYMISFKNLASNIYSLSGYRGLNSTYGYAYHGNFKV